MKGRGQIFMPIETRHKNRIVKAWRKTNNGARGRNIKGSLAKDKNPS